MIKVYEKISRPEIRGASGWDRSGYGERDDKDTPGEVISEEIVYEANVEYINGINKKRHDIEYNKKAIELYYCECLEPMHKDQNLRDEADKEMLAIAIDMMEKGYKRYVVDNIWQRYKSDNQKQFNDLFDEQVILYELLELKKNSKYDYIVDYLEARWYEGVSPDELCILVSESIIESYISQNYPLPVGYRFKLNSINEIYDSVCKYRYFDRLRLDVYPPTGSINNEKINICTLDINLEKSHIGKIGSKINFDAIDARLDNNIKEIIHKCEVFDKSYPNKDNRSHCYSIEFGKERSIISKYEIEKLKEYYLCIDKLIKKHKCMLLSYEFKTITSEIEYNDYGIIRNIQAIQVYINVEDYLYNEPVLMMSGYGLEEIGLEAFENIFENKILPKYNEKKVRMRPYLALFSKLEENDNFNKIDRDLYTSVCNDINNEDIKSKSYKKLNNAIKLREELCENRNKYEEKIRIEKEERKKNQENEEKQRREEELLYKENKKLKNKIKKILGMIR